MAYSKEKLKPSDDLVELLAPIVFEKVRSSSEHTTTRVRQCFKCMQSIKKGGKYINHQFKYDKRILTVSLHIDCFK